MAATAKSVDNRDVTLETEQEHQNTLHFRSIRDPYTVHKVEDDISSNYSTLNTNNVQSMLQGGLEYFYEKYGQRLREINMQLPTPEVRFQDLSYTVTCPVPRKNDESTVGSHLQKLFLPWKKTETYEKVILKPMNGIILPGSMTLILGGPGCGKSTFLKALGGKLKENKSAKVGGRVLYSGLSADQIELSKLVSLVDQTDDHCPTLTVRETIQFADFCLNGRVEDQPENMRGIAARRTDLMLHILGLTGCADTVVGDALLRGVSGGERKRVTVGEMLVGGQSIFLCDEISTGLDSAATFDIMQSLRTWTKTLGGSAVVALLQPPPEVVDLFDDIILLSQGQLIFQGPRTSLLPYFSQLGYDCPVDIDPADYFIEVTEGRGYAFRNGTVPDIDLPMTTKAFHEKFEQSHYFHNLTQEIRRGYNLPVVYDRPEHFRQIRSIANLAYSKKTSAFAMDLIPSTMLLIKRQAMLTVRDRPLLIGKTVEAFTVGLILGMIFYNADQSLYLRMLFFSIAIFQRQAWQQITICFQLRTIFYKQRSRNFFRTISYGVAEAVVQVPVNLVVSLLMGTVFYFLSGLAVDAGRFSTFILILVAFQHAIGAYFTFLSALSPSITIAQAFAGISVCFFLLFSGNIILADLIPKGWIWMYWFDPVAWALRSVILNQFKSSVYTPQESATALNNFQIRQGAEYIWIGIAILFLYYLTFTSLEAMTLHYLRYDEKKVATGAVAAETDASMVATGAVGDKEEKDVSSTDDDEISIQVGKTNYQSGTSGALKDESKTFIPAYLCIRNLKYSVPGKEKGSEIQLLTGITAYFKPGTMTALMGSSGAGKTTLMDVIAGRKTGGTISGDMLVNGLPKNPKTFSRIAAYCEQMDIHSGAATVQEALHFSAKLRLPETTSMQDRLDLVSETMTLLELNSLADCIIGTQQTGGLSVEQRKRLTIAVELVSNPSILFLDEPTSGLDARSAQVVMRGVQSIARSGRTVLCTIHQPSVQIFNLFDHLLLLKRGGSTAYFGPLGKDSQHMLEYFVSIPGTSEIQTLYNPATYMLEVIGAGIGRGQMSTDYAEEYAKSELNKRNIADTEALSSPQPFMKKFPEYEPIATGVWNQLTEASIKATKTYWRSPGYNFVRLVMFPLFAIIFGTTFFDLGLETEGKVTSQIALIYNSMDFIGVINLMTVLEITTAERAVFYRERSANMYGPLAYSFAMFIAEVPYLFTVGTIFVTTEYWLVGLDPQASSFLFFWFVFLLYNSICTFFGQWMCALMPNAKVANVAVGAASCFFNLFGGYLLPVIRMKSYYKWFKYLMPSSYALNALVTSQMGVCKNGVGNGCVQTRLNNQAQESLADFVVRVYGFEADKRFTDMTTLIAIVIFIQASIYLTLRFVSHLKR